MERAELEETPAFITLPLKEELGAKAAVDARVERRKATVFILTGGTDVEIGNYDTVGYTSDAMSLEM